MRVTCIGLGVIGFNMAGHLSKNDNFDVTVWNSNKDKSQKWKKPFSSVVVESLEAAIVDADRILMCAGKDEDIEYTMLSGKEFINNINHSAIIIDHKTTYNLAAKLYQTCSLKMLLL